MVQRKLLYAWLCAILSVFISSQLLAQEDVIEKRRKLMKANSKGSKAIKKAVKANDFTTIEAEAKEIAANMEKIPDLYPKGSTSEKSRAKPAIWEKWDSFTQKVTTMKTAAEKLADAAMAKDEQEVSAQVKGFGKNCGSCHKPFRKPKKKKK